MSDPKPVGLEYVEGMRDAISLIEVNVSNRLWMRLDDIPKPVAQELRKKFEHNNPAYHKKVQMGYGAGSEVPAVKTWKHTLDDDGVTWLSVPRGGTNRIREVFGEHGLDYEFVDEMCRGNVTKCGGGYTGDWVTPQIFPNQKQVPWDHQDRMVQAIRDCNQGVVRAPTGSGKTSALIEAIRIANVPAIVIVWESGLLEQWQKRIHAELGIKPKHQGLIQGKTCRLKPITLAMQQTLNKYTPEKWDNIRGVFGFVGADECFEAGTPVLMADGTHKRIVDVQVGDVTAIGGEVLDTMRHEHVGPMYRLNGLLVTAGHPVATAVGWVPLSKLRCDDIMWYDPKYALRQVQQETPSGLPSTHMREVSNDVIQKRSVPGLRCACGEGQARDSCAALRGRPMEQGADCAGRSPSCELQQRVDTFGDCEGKHSQGDGQACGEEAPPRSCIDSAEEALQRSCPAGTVTGDNAPNGGGWPGHPVRGAQVREWSEADAFGIGDAEALGGRLRQPTCGEHGIGPTLARTLQDRLESHPDEGGDRTGREQPQCTGPEGIGRAQDILPRIEGVVGLTLPGACRLSQGRPAVQASSVTAATVYNIETERNVYVAAGTLVHNCQRYAATTFTKTIDEFDSLFRIAVSADETRKDQKEFLIYDHFGQIICDIPKKELQGKGIIHEVQAEVIPTEFEADWYVDSPQPDFSELLRQMIEDDDRNSRIVNAAVDYYEQGETILLFTHRIAHAHTLRSMLAAKGVVADYMLGGVENQKDFVRTVERMRDLEDPLRVAIGTLGKVGVGLDIPNLTVGIATTPIHNNKQFMNQVKGRICRRCTESGKTHAKLVYMWDREVFGQQPLLNLNRWNKEVFVQHTAGRMIDVIEYLKEHYEDTRRGSKPTDDGIFATAESFN